MSMNMKVMLMGLVILTAVFKIKAADYKNTRIQCWHCGSDVGGAEDFCGAEFKEDNIPWDVLKERNLSVMRTCNSTINSEHERAVCRKTVEDIDGKVVVKRFCYYTAKMDTLDHCMSEPTEKNVHRKFCEDCLTDKCNGAAMLGGNYMASSISSATVLIALFMGHNINV